MINNIAVDTTLNNYFNEFKIAVCNVCNVLAMCMKIEHYASLNGGRGGIFIILAPRILDDFAYGKIASLFWPLTKTPNCG